MSENEQNVKINEDKGLNNSSINLFVKNENKNRNDKEKETIMEREKENEEKINEDKEKDAIENEIEKNKETNEKVNNEFFNMSSKIEKLKISHSQEMLNSERDSSSISSLSPSLDSLNMNDSGVIAPATVIEDKINTNSKTLNLTSPGSTKAKATSSTIFETASSSVIVNSKNNITSSILHIKNSSSSNSLNINTMKSNSSSKKNQDENNKKKYKGKHKAKTDEEQEINEIRNSINFSDVDLADEFMGLASSSVVNKNKDKSNLNIVNSTTNNNISNSNSNNNHDDITTNKNNKKGKNKSKESKSETNINKASYTKGTSAIVEGPYTVFHSSSSSSSLDFLLESAAVASSSRNIDEPPLNINFNRRIPNQQLNSDQINNSEDDHENNSDNERFDIDRLASSSSSSLLGLRYTQKNLDDILLKPVPIDQSIKCTLIRSKMKNVPSYELYIENTDSTFSLLLYSRKVKIGNHNEYVITKKIFTNSVPEESEIIGRLKSNFVGTAFVLYDNNKKHVRKENINELRSELGAVLYEPNILGFKGPRKMKIITTRLNEQGEFIPCKPLHAKDTLIERSKDPFDREMLVLYNKAPQWNEETQSYVLNFNHRVRIASVKNFQIINNDDLDYIIMQFGKKKKNIFTLDFRYPFSALLAFAIALTSLDTKIACE